MTNSTELDLCLIGVGSMGRNHARVIAQHPRTKLSMFIDPDEETGRAVAAQYGAEQIAQSAQPLRRGLVMVAFQGVEQRRCVLRLGGVLAQRAQ